MNNHREPISLPKQFFVREDESPDELFYKTPGFSTHIDAATIENLTHFYRETLPSSFRLLDLMSSWISHLPEEVSYRHVTGLGMNEEQLRRNRRLDTSMVQNLNEVPELPFEDGRFEAVMIVVSIQYLIRPFAVLKEISRVLTSGGKCIIEMSHRLFPTKAIYAFQVLSPADRCRLVTAYLHQTGMFNSIEVVDRSPPNADPLWLVVGTKEPSNLLQR